MKFWVEEVERSEGFGVKVKDVFFAGDPLEWGEGSHIEVHKSEVIIQNITMFPGILSDRDAIFWGLRGLYRRASWPIRKHTKKGKETLEKVARLKERNNG